MAKQRILLILLAGIFRASLSLAGSQSGLVPMILAPHYQSAASGERMLSFEIVANVPYQVQSDVSWATPQMRAGGIYLHLAENTTFDSRTAHITISSPDGSIKEELNVTQAGNESELVKYLQGTIECPPTDYPQTKPLVLLDIGRARDSIWGAWKLANRTRDEQKLPELTPLAEEVQNTWVIPASYPEAGAGMAFYYGRRGTRPSAGYPLFFYLHGSGDRDNEYAFSLNFSKQMDTSPSAHFAPRIPQTGQWYRWYQQSKQWAWERMLRMAMCSGDIDPDRIYVLGISEGGYGGQRLASFYADYWAAAGPMAGGEPLINAPAENLRNTPFSLRTGSLDTGFGRNLFTTYTGQALDSLQSLDAGGYEHMVRLEEGYGHSIDYYPTPAWMKQYRRSPQPRVVRWEDFEMDGRHRSGFANLQVLERPDANLRTRYDETIEGNTVRLDVKNVTYTTVEWIDGINARFSRDMPTARQGKVRIYLSEEMVDFLKPVCIIVNGEERFNGMLTPDVKDMVNSVALFYDPRRIFPASVDVELR